jgi:hypothetical protein
MTKLFLRNTTTNGIGATYFDMVTAAGGAPITDSQYRRKTPEQVKQERINLGIIPPEVEKIVVKIAKTAIKKAAATQTSAIDIILKQQAEYEKKLRIELARHQQVWDSAYRRLFEIAVYEAIMD